MKRKEIKIPIFDWDLVVLEVESDKDYSHLQDFKEVNVSAEDYNEIKDGIRNGIFNGGLSFSNSDLNKSVIILYKMESELEKLKTLGHEKRHIEDYILQELDIHDAETAGLLAGYLAGELFINNT